jgi:prevent-host-death family protein
MRRMAAAKFKATCLRVMDEVTLTGEAVEITKRGKVVARLVPASSRRFCSWKAQAFGGPKSGHADGPTSNSFAAVFACSARGRTGGGYRWTRT